MRAWGLNLAAVSKKDELEAPLVLGSIFQRAQGQGAQCEGAGSLLGHTRPVPWFPGTGSEEALGFPAAVEKNEAVLMRCSHSAERGPSPSTGGQLRVSATGALGAGPGIQAPWRGAASEPRNHSALATLPLLTRKCPTYPELMFLAGLTKD